MALSWLLHPSKRQPKPCLRARRPADRPRRFRPLLEALEDRYLLATVTTLLDNAPGSLREAIAITEPGGVVDFAPGLSGTITLTSGQLTIDHDLTIAGPGAEVITVSGNNSSRVFGTSATVTISGLTIADGESSANGGGIFNSGMLTVIDTIIRANTSLASFPNGGGGIFSSGTLTITRSTISGNTASSRGGGIYNTGLLAIDHSTIESNSAQTNVGGGVYNGAMLNVASSTIIDNVAATNGGGISNSGTAIVSYSFFSGNRFESITNNSGTFTFVNSTSINDGRIGNGTSVPGAATMTVL